MKFITHCIVEDGSNQRRVLRLNVLMVGAFLTERGMEFQMKTDDQEKAR